MKNQKQFTKEFAAQFKLSYSYKMGGTQTVILPNGQSFFFDDREYYSGRGAKYNSSIRHDAIGDVVVTKKALNEALKAARERAKWIKQQEAAKKRDEKEYEENRKKGVYGLNVREYGTFVALSYEEARGQYFDAVRLARTLDISVEDAELLNSRGKTYVFAKQISTGRVIELYHSSLDCNDLSISVDYPSAERIAEFNHDEWASAPYSHLVGMTSNKNHFVC